MKRNDITKLHEQTVPELDKVSIDLVNQLAKARLEKAAHKLENVTLVKTLSTDIARVKTIIKEKKLEDLVKKIKADSKKAETKEETKQVKKEDTKKINKIVKKTKKEVLPAGKKVKKDGHKK
jgi:ribosomal protein L29